MPHPPEGSTIYGELILLAQNFFVSRIPGKGCKGVVCEMNDIPAHPEARLAMQGPVCPATELIAATAGHADQ
jgi:hypothetical protein